jgi:BirA family biotin operon repressor/biotin-[acetyl-CoA-carboxylase] ligase
LPECHSTNIDAARLAEEDAIDGTIVITENQISGKGQRGNTWKAEAGKNLTFSIVLRPTFLSVREQFDLNRAISLGIVEYIGNMIKNKVQIKWPNDIMIDEKKVCGILIENSVSGIRINHTIVGIGLNMNQQSFEFPSATSLRNFTKVDFDLSVELERLVLCIESRYLLLKTGNYESIRNDYQDNLLWRGETRLFRFNKTTFEGRIIGDNDEGRLLIDTTDGVRSLGVKEVEYLR